MKKLKLSLLIASLFPFYAAAETNWKDAIEQNFQETVEMRRHIHQNAELGNQEFETQKYIVDFLKQNGIEVVTGWKDAPTAVIGIINPDKGNTIALRTELDALPIKENTGLPFASTQKGINFGEKTDVSHMCGHDLHMAMLLSAAKILQAHKDEIDNRIVLIFQPSEEGDTTNDPFAENPPNFGANALVQDGLIKKYDIQNVFGIHAMANQPSGKLLIAKGTALNSVDTFDILVEGNQSHGAMPWNGVDATYTAADIVVNLQQIVSRNIDLSKGMGVITVGKLTAGETDNVMSGTANMLGTIRSNNNDIRAVLLKRIPEVAQNIGEATGAKVTTRIIEIYPVTVNNPELAENLVGNLQNAGLDASINNWNPGASEDFSFYAREVPSVFMFLGVDAPDTKQIANNHSDKFNPDEAAMKSGVLAHIIAATATKKADSKE